MRVKAGVSESEKMASKQARKAYKVAFAFVLLRIICSNHLTIGYVVQDASSRGVGGDVLVREKEEQAVRHSFNTAGNE
jgi:hypothetical protein